LAEEEVVAHGGGALGVAVAADMRSGGAGAAQAGKGLGAHLVGRGGGWRRRAANGDWRLPTALPTGLDRSLLGPDHIVVSLPRKSLVV